MKNVSTIVAVICVATLGCSLVKVVAPQGNTKKILNTVLGVFIICCMLIPIKNAINDFNVNINIAKPQDELIASADEAYNKAVLIETKANLESTILVYLENNKISVDEVAIKLSSYDNGGIYISRIDIYISKEMKHYSNDIVELIKKKFDIKPHIYVR